MHTKKITMATLKSFIKNNRSKLQVKCKSSFDGSIDGLQYFQNGFSSVVEEKHNLENTLAIKGAWIVGHSRDYFRPYADSSVTGIEVYNSCGSFIVAIPNN